MARGGALCGGDIPTREVAAADVNHLALLYQQFYCLPELLPWCAPIYVVHLLEVDVIHLQLTQAVLAGLSDVVSREAAVIRADAHRLIERKNFYPLERKDCTL